MINGIEKELGMFTLKQILEVGAELDATFTPIGVFDIYDDYTINNLVKDCDRRVQYQNMIYLGDGLTDVPCMRLVKGNGGYSIAIYQDKKKVEKLVSDNRVDFICPADYSLNSEVDTVIKMILDNICQNEIIRKYKERQL